MPKIDEGRRVQSGLHVSGSSGKPHLLCHWGIWSIAGEPYWCWFTLLFYYYFPITDFFTSEFTLRPFLDVNNMFSKGQLRRPYILLIANRLHSSLHYNICLNIDGCPDTSSLNNLLRNTVLYLCIIMFHLFLWKTISNFSMQKYFQSSSELWRL